MSQPPKDVLTFGLTPNPDPNPYPSKGEPIGDELKRQQAVLAAIQRAAAKHGWQVRQPGEIDPTSKPNPERAEDIKDKVQPALISVARRFGPTFTASSVKQQDGTELKNVQARGECETKIELNIGQVTELASRIVEMAEEKIESLFGFAGKLVVTIVHAVEGRQRVSRVSDTPIRFDSNASELLKNSMQGAAASASREVAASPGGEAAESSQFPPSIMHDESASGGMKPGTESQMLGGDVQNDDPLSDLGI